MGSTLEPKLGSASVHYAGTDQELDRRAERARIAKRSRKLLHEETRLFPDLTNESLERMAKIAVGLNPDDKPKEREFQFPNDPASIAKARRQAQEIIDRLRSAAEEAAEQQDYDD